ncbi:hypothetical protein OE88DRAFT_65969 [Heliocybe sulcata]|uniref:Copper transporter n=1 Tax=Heliocybe sulcata TaxID=5364 RepID=A0A5C3NHM4_9AGAM|nr:hypothetical protein OE88DRAFT_65969 [Heliocybe sulcata]
MKMEGWEDRLHFQYLGEHVLFGSLVLNSFAHFLLASCLTFFLCISERLLTLALNKHWSPFASTRHSRTHNALWRAALYWIVTFVRLLYMLIAMTFHLGILVVTVTALTAGQFIIEYYDAPQPHRNSRDMYSTKEPLLDYSPEFSESSSYPLRMDQMKGRPRSKSKPESIFIHPNESNIARADAVALELGLGGDTELVKGNMYPDDDDAWELGKGKEVARALLHGTLKDTTNGTGHHRHSSSQQRLFHIGEEDSDEERAFS